MPNNIFHDGKWIYGDTPTNEEDWDAAILEATVHLRRITNWSQSIAHSEMDEKKSLSKLIAMKDKWMLENA